MYLYIHGVLYVHADGSNFSVQETLRYKKRSLHQGLYVSTVHVYFVPIAIIDVMAN